MEWRHEAVCRNVDPEWFFPVAREGTPQFEREARRALAVCEVCPVRRECLEFALTTRSEGIWGGRTEGQRRRRKVAA